MKNKYPAILGILVSAILLVYACKHETDEVNPLDPNPSDTNSLITCDPDTAYFQNEVLPIFQSSCALSGCHDATTAEQDLILSDYSHIISSGNIEPGDASESEIYEKITESDEEDRMPPPPNPRLSNEKIALIMDWINQGARDNYCDSDCDTTIFTFSGAVNPIIDQHCVGCHNASLSSGGVRLDTYEYIAAIASDGRLIGTITHTDGFPKMPFNGNKLPDCKITQIKKWIDADFQEN